MLIILFNNILLDRGNSTHIQKEGKEGMIIDMLKYLDKMIEFNGLKLYEKCYSLDENLSPLITISIDESDNFYCCISTKVRPDNPCYVIMKIPDIKEFYHLFKNEETYLIDILKSLGDKAYVVQEINQYSPSSLGRLISIMTIEELIDSGEINQYSTTFDNEGMRDSLLWLYKEIEEENMKEGFIINANGIRFE